MKTHKILTRFVIILLAFILIFLTAYHYIGYDKLSFYNQDTNQKSQEEEIKTTEVSNAKIVCIGDSQTVMNNGYPVKLEDLVNLKITTFGGKQLTSRDIAARLNAYPLYTRKITIPEDASAVKIELYNNNGLISTLLQNEASSIPTCSIDGIEGRISYSDRSYIFTRSEEGDSKTIDGAIRIEFTKQDINEEDIVVFLMGNYDDEDDYFDNNLVTFYNSIIDEYNIKNYIVIGLTTRSNSDEANKTLKKNMVAIFWILNHIYCLMA